MTTPQGDDPTVVDAEIVDAPTSTPAHVGPPAFTPDYSADGVPSFDYVRDRIERRAHTAPAEVELAGLGGTGPDVEALDAQRTARDEAARAKLDEIRRAMGKG
ncbi:hypothetical protein [Actinosynnema sp. NPDC023587]|uniref:hypothetical protein n=1 Tax=Actinosynnema sp. NPDC023587 TaxID=3154695 RepID=UPI0033CBE2B5